MNEKMNIIKNNLVETINNKQKRLDSLLDKLKESELEGNEYKQERFKRYINDDLNIIKSIQRRLESIRPIDINDVETRKDIYLNYSSKVNDIIPDDIPLVFHGNNNIGMVEEIIKSGGLFTPSERDVSYKSFASQIDVTWKGNIQTSLEFAEPGIDSFYPYGALFVFLPKEEEYEYVLNTGNSSEVYNGVQSIDFKNDNRLLAVITTEENIERLKKCMKDSDIDENLVMTHEEFLLYCKNKYHSHTL